MALFEGATINTPSMIAVEDQLDALAWAESIGGLPGLIERSEANLRVISSWVNQSEWAAFLAADEATRSSTSICLQIKDPWFTGQSEDDQQALIKKMVALLETEGAALDIGGYRDAPAGLRIWGGGTVEAQDTQKLMPWLDWAWASVKGAG